MKSITARLELIPIFELIKRCIFHGDNTSMKPGLEHFCKTTFTNWFKQIGFEGTFFVLQQLFYWRSKESWQNFLFGWSASSQSLQPEHENDEHGNLRSRYFGSLLLFMKKVQSRLKSSTEMLSDIVFLPWWIFFSFESFRRRLETANKKIKANKFNFQQKLSQKLMKLMWLTRNIVKNV